MNKNISNDEVEQYSLSHKRDVTTLTMSHDGKLFLTISNWEKAKLWDGETSKYVKAFKHDKIDNGIFSPDDRYIATASENQTNIWDVKTGNCLYELCTQKNRRGVIGFSNNGKYLATAGYAKENEKSAHQIWNLETGKCSTKLTDYGTSLHAIGFSNDDKYVITIRTNTAKSATIWDRETGKCLQTFVVNPNAPTIFGMYITPVKQRFVNYKASIGNKCVMLHDFNPVKIWSAQTGEDLFVLTPDENHIPRKTTLSSDEKLLAVGFDDGTVKVWSLENNSECLFAFTDHHAAIDAISFNHEGDYLVTRSQNGVTKAWNMSTGKCSLSCTTGNNEIAGIALGHLAKYLVIFSKNNHISTLWKMKKKHDHFLNFNEFDLNFIYKSTHSKKNAFDDAKLDDEKDEQNTKEEIIEHKELKTYNDKLEIIIHKNNSFISTIAAFFNSWSA